MNRTKKNVIAKRHITTKFVFSCGASGGLDFRTERLYNLVDPLRMIYLLNTTKCNSNKLIWYKCGVINKFIKKQDGLQLSRVS